MILGTAALAADDEVIETRQRSASRKWRVAGHLPPPPRREKKRLGRYYSALPSYFALPDLYVHRMIMTHETKLRIPPTLITSPASPFTPHTHLPHYSPSSETQCAMSPLARSPSHFAPILQLTASISPPPPSLKGILLLHVSQHCQHRRTTDGMSCQNFFNRPMKSLYRSVHVPAIHGPRDARCILLHNSCINIHCMPRCKRTNVSFVRACKCELTPCKCAAAVSGPRKEAYLDTSTSSPKDDRSFAGKRKLKYSCKGRRALSRKSGCCNALMLFHRPLATVLYSQVSPSIETSGNSFTAATLHHSSVASSIFEDWGIYSRRRKPRLRSCSSILLFRSLGTFGTCQALFHEC